MPWSIKFSFWPSSFDVECSFRHLGHSFIILPLQWQCWLKDFLALCLCTLPFKLQPCKLLEEQHCKWINELIRVNTTPWTEQHARVWESTKGLEAQQSGKLFEDISWQAGYADLGIYFVLACFIQKTEVIWPSPYCEHPVGCYPMIPLSVVQ